MTNDIKTVKRQSNRQEDVYDYLIVGAGSSGCVVANRLSESGTKRVLLLEAGPYDNSVVISVPSAPGIFGWERFDWGYHSLPDSTRRQKSEHWPAGRVVGGSSSINGMNYVRGSASDFDRWAEMGNVGWAAKDVMPLFRRMERCDPKSISQTDHIRGREGPLHVKLVEGRHPLTETFIEAAKVEGYRFNPDYNGADQEGVGYAQVTQRGGRRWSAADAFLKPVMKRPNLELIVDAHVHKLLITGRRVCGVLYEKDGTLHEVQARRVILSAGAINTPKLLMLSGIGDAGTLKKHGIDVVLDRPSVGRNLMEHPIVMLLYRMNVPTYNLTGGLFQKVGFLAKYLLKGQGPLSMFFESIAFLKTSQHEPVPDVQLHFAPFGWSVGDINDNAPSLASAASYPCVSILINKSHPLSRGYVSLACSNPKAAPLIKPQLLECDEDVKTLARATMVVRRIMAQMPMAKFVNEETSPGAHYSTWESLGEYIKGDTQVAAHPAGTCRMGIDRDAVVTPDLRVKGVENLWIADASIMPDLISGNLNASCMMIGEKLGRILTVES